jgi:transcriptional regulator with XRE-family HTH domain
MKNLKEVVGKRIETLELTNEYVAGKLGMSRTGLWQSLEKSSLKPEKLQILFELLNIEPNFIFGWNRENLTSVLNEPIEEYKIKRKNDTKVDTLSEVDFLRSQVKELTEIIKKLSSKIDTSGIS